MGDYFKMELNRRITVMVLQATMFAIDTKQDVLIVTLSLSPSIMLLGVRSLWMIRFSLWM